LFEWKFKEVNRIKSPGGEAEAVILEGDAGATTPNTTVILTVRSGQKIDPNNFPKWDEVFRASHLKNLHVVWKEPTFLEIQYDEARIDQFSNLRHITDGGKETYPVEIRLAPTGTTFSVPLNDRTPVPLQ
jgi:hypothetical protein